MKRIIFTSKFMKSNEESGEFANTQVGSGHKLSRLHGVA